MSSQQTQAAVQAMPHGQVDWAALAQQWIALKDHDPSNAGGQNNSLAGPPRHMHSGGPPGFIHGVPPGHMQGGGHRGPIHGIANQNHMQRPPGMPNNTMHLQRPPVQLHTSSFTGPGPMQRTEYGFGGGDDKRVLSSYHPSPPPSSQPGIVPPPPPLVREQDVGVPGEELGSHAGREGGEENMELEDEQDEDGGSGWGGSSTGWNNPGWGSTQSQGWSEGSASHSNSPEIFSSRFAEQSHVGGKGGNSSREGGGRWKESRVEQRGPPIPSLPSLMEVDTSNVATLNEAQRKKLPSWIRAGLEKMEKDKLKKEQDEERKIRTENKKRMARLEVAKLSKDPASSKFDSALSDNEDGDLNGSPKSNQEMVKKQRKSRFDEDNGGDVDKISTGLKPTEDISQVEENRNLTEPSKSKEEILAEMSTNLRMLLTTLLLEVTGEEIDQISSEVLNKARIRTTSKPKLQTLLSGYGSASSSSGSDSEEPESDQELKSSLSKKRKHFKTIQSKILDFCDEETAAYKSREKVWLEGKDNEQKDAVLTPSTSPSQATAGRSSSSSSDSDTSKSSSPETKGKMKSKRKHVKRNRDSSANSNDSYARKVKKSSERIATDVDLSTSSNLGISGDKKVSKHSEKYRRSRSKESLDHKRSCRSKSPDMKIKKSRSRSRRRSRSREKRRYRSRSKDRKRSRSREKRRSRSRGTSRRARSRSSERKRARSRDRKRSTSRHRKKSRSVSSSRSKKRSSKESRRTKSRSQSIPRKRSRSRSRKKRARRSRS